ncbi:Kre5p [Sporobolomyces salmoneus]|uniref:Kre5p n=1 Tax=Sporobolomyces salmoneus TaxID=183962 RepID=UPI003175A4C0
MKISWLIWALSSYLVAASTSPPISASIETAWPEASLVTQYLETVALEQPNHFFPFLSSLSSSPTSYLSLRPPLLPSSLSALTAYDGINAAFTPEGTLRPNETLAVLEDAARRSLLFRRKGTTQSLQLALANREASVIIEGMRGLWEARRDEIIGESSSEECESWIDVQGQIACSVEEFWDIVGQEQKTEKSPISLSKAASTSSRPPVYSIDHVTPPRADHLPRVVFYASPTSPSFQHLFTFLFQLSNPKPVPVSTTSSGTVAPHPPRLQFVLRWKPSRAAIQNRKRLVLTGYGAALDIKKSDYLAIDDRLNAPSGGGERAMQLDKVKLAPVQKVDIPELSLRTAQYIMSSNDSFKAFTSLTSSFPLVASELSTLVPDISPQLVSEVSTNQATSQLAQRPAFLLNGITLTEAQVDPFALIRLMRKERKFVTELQGLSATMTTKAAREILINGGTKPVVATEQGLMPVEALGELFDATDRTEGGEVIIWWNDLEKDKRYKTWPSEVRDLLRPTYPGSMNLVARNLNNVVFVLDLSQPSSLVLIAQNLKQFITRGIPIRFGLVPIVAATEGVIESEMAQVMFYLVETAGRGITIRFLQDLLEASPTSKITPDLLRRAYARLFLQSQTSESGPLAPFESVLAGIGGASEATQSHLEATRKYLKRLGVPLVDGQSAPSEAFFLNGAHFPIDEDLSQNLQRTLGLHLQFLQQQVYLGSLTDEHEADTYFADLPSTYSRRNPYIFSSADAKPLKIVDLIEAQTGILPKYVESFYIEGTSGRIDEETGFDIEDPPAVVTITIVTDLNEPAGTELVKSAMQLLETNTSIRVSLLHNPVEHYEAHPWALSNVLYLLYHYDSFEDLHPSELIAWIDLGLTVGGPLPRHGQDWKFGNPLRPMLKAGVEADQSMDAQFLWEELQWLGFKLGFQPGQTGIVINGRVVGPFPEESFALPDLQALVSYELEKRINPLVAAIKNTDFDISKLKRSQQSKIYNLASSIVQQAYLPDPTTGLFGGAPTERRRDYMCLEGNHSSVVSANDRGALYEIAVVVDPATELAQRWAPIIETLASLDTVHLRLYLNPTFGLAELPIKRFYQYTFQPSLRFDNVTGQELQPSVRFEGVPEDTLFTFAIDTPRSWLAFPKSSVHDLDNIRLEDLPESSREKGVEAVLELESLVVEGHAREMPSSKPPRGLQLELSSNSSKATTVDTIVMANLGYFQFKANPGVWHLGLRSGKSSEVYEIESIGADGWKSAEVEKTGDALVVSTFEGLTLHPRFRRKPGHEFTELLDESGVAKAKATTFTGFADRVKSMIPFFAPRQSTDLVATTKKADINVFTVASGLLYERMAFLMIVSVLRHTKSSVKFWFIQNFLSPSFKAFIPHMAREYGFDYELVTYKWPHWLRAQKEKQRTIWGYKILFLDVLFPLELDRVIFVDSDQIVRADLKELIDLDLEGACYAYAPMGNDREETKGYRFWEHGYWKQHLDGRPYHISALYVVDLDRFRQIAAGDRLRQQYQALTADPGSLANLDQDLPNNMQNSLPIYTLDRSWLWCETWCSDESLATAKTIDLCNNPKTKEQKLARARRLIPEWTVYDDEVAALARRVACEVEGTASEKSELAAFGSKADELEQAVQQSQERDEVVKEAEKLGGRVKDEL